MSPISFVTLAVVAMAASAHGAAVGSTMNPNYWPVGGLNGVSTHIVGGKESEAGEFPHQVSMQVSMFWIIESHICGGTIVADKWILTAAHCIKGVPWYTSAFILAGKHHLGKSETTQQRVGVKKMHVHEKYSTGGGVGPYDIGLLELSSALTFNDRVKPANLPVKDAIPTGDATLSGWGSTSNTNTAVMPSKLQKVVLPIINWSDCNDWCQKMSDANNRKNPLADTNVCVGYLDTKGQGACRGDSGGPLVQTDANGNYVVIGATSWGYFPCQSQPAPSVYTRVSAYVDWINKKIGQ